MRAYAAIASVLLASCTDAREERCASAWRPVFTDLDRAVLAVGGTATDDVYLVGGGLGTPGRGSLVAHYDGFFWRELVIDRSENLWWVHAVGPGDVWMVGDRGLAMHWNGKRFRVVPTHTNATLFGAWGSKSDDVWFAGGRPGQGESPDNAVLLHWDGRRISRERSIPQKSVSFFKVFDEGDDLWLTGEAGSLLHRKGSGWRDRSAEVSVLTSPFSLGGCSKDELYAVGGKSIYSFDGASWSLEDATVPTLAIGVACGESSVLAVGTGGMKLRYDKKKEIWIDEQADEPYDTDFHGGWIAPDDSEWAVGGDILVHASPERTGVVGYRGCDEIAKSISIVDRVPVIEEDEPFVPDAGVPEEDAAVHPDAEPRDGGEPIDRPDAQEPDAFAPDAVVVPDAGCSGPQRAPMTGDLMINEILVDPAPDVASGDANADGVRSASDDEFLEIVNLSGSPLAIGGLVLSDSVGIRHIFAPSTLDCGKAIVVFGGGDPSHPNWQPSWTTASEGALGLNNGGDVIDLSVFAFGDIYALAWGPEAEIDQSITKSPDLDEASPYVPHTTLPGGRSFSPGARTDGTSF